MTDPAARAALNRADQLVSEVTRRWPHAWPEMDRMRTNPPQPWPRWCLLPMAAAAAVVTDNGRVSFPPPPIGAVSALYAWRFCRSVYLVEPGLMGRLLTQIPDAIDVDAVANLPEWCCLVVDPGHDGGLWIHLESDAATGRPELRILLDLGGGGLESLMPIPVYLDRPSVTEALADMRATALATLSQRNADVRGGDLDVAVADLAGRVDAYLAIAAYLSRPEADIIGDRGDRPQRRTRVAQDRRVWRVGYGG